MTNLSTHDAKARFERLLEAARNGPVTIEKHGREMVVLISMEEFDALQAVKLRQLRAEVKMGLDDFEAGRFTELTVAAMTDFGGTMENAGRKRKSRK